MFKITLPHYCNLRILSKQRNVEAQIMKVGNINHCLREDGKQYEGHTTDRKGLFTPRHGK